MISASKSMILLANDRTTGGVDIFNCFDKFAVLLLWADDGRRQVWYGMGAPFKWIMRDSQETNLYQASAQLEICRIQLCKLLRTTSDSYAYSWVKSPDMHQIVSTNMAHAKTPPKLSLESISLLSVLSIIYCYKILVTMQEICKQMCEIKFGMSLMLYEPWNMLKALMCLARIIARVFMLPWL